AVSAPAVSATVAVASAPAPVPALAAKPVQGSEEWRKIRRDNHKEVERRRRENINDGITQLAELVPNSEKNKGAILKQAVKYIESIEEANKKLMADIEAGSSTKLDLDKALVEKSILKTSLESLKVEHEQLKRDLDALKGQLNEESDEHTSKRQRTE
ncbi:basic helix-loop-helix protein, partial [Lunasporangiospora selenospora]